MKKFDLLLVGLLLAGVVFAATWDNGVGYKVYPSTTSQKQTLATTVNTLSLYNSGTNEVEVLVNCSTNTFHIAVTNGTAIKIPVSSTYTFDAQGNASIESFCYATTVSTSTVYAAGY